MKFLYQLYRHFQFFVVFITLFMSIKYIKLFLIWSEIIMHFVTTNLNVSKTNKSPEYND